MITHPSMKFFTYALVFVFAFTVALPITSAHEGEDTPKTTTPVSEAAKIAQMKQIITVLTQVVELLQKKGVLLESTDHHAESASNELSISVEVHSYKTHVHIKETGKAEESFIIDDIEYKAEKEVIAAIAKKTGFSVHDIEEVITFPEGELNAKGDSVAEHDEDHEQDESGIHIMNDGKIMWGHGAEVVGASLTADGKIKLSDGDIITPAFDLR